MVSLSIIKMLYFHIKEIFMTNKLDKHTKDNQEFYEGFLKFTLYSCIAITIIIALLAFFLV